MKKLIIATICYLLCGYSEAAGMDDLPQEVKDMLKSLHANCIGESGTSEASVQDVNKGNFAESKELKCYMKCIFGSIGIMDDDGVMDWDTYEGLLPDFMRDYGMKVVDKCKSIGPTGDACDTAFLINKCAYETDPKEYLLF